LVKAVFFDWFNTLATYDPPREESYQRAFAGFGFEIPLKVVHKGILVGDRKYFSLNTRSSISGKSLEERLKFFICYTQSIADTAGIEVSQEIQLQILKNVSKEFSNVMVLFPDVLANIRKLKDEGLLLGIISNAEKSISVIIENVGLKPYIDFVVTSEDAGVEKPAPGIFLKALENTTANPDEVVYVGDQYASDILGARGVGMNGILIDRYDISPNTIDCKKVRNMDELIEQILGLK